MLRDSQASLLSRYGWPFISLSNPFKNPSSGPARVPSWRDEPRVYELGGGEAVSFSAGAWLPLRLALLPSVTECDRSQVEARLSTGASRPEPPGAI